MPEGDLRCDTKKISIYNRVTLASRLLQVLLPTVLVHFLLGCESTIYGHVMNTLGNILLLLLFAYHIYMSVVLGVSTPLPVKVTSYHLFSKQFPYCAKLRGLSVLLLLCGDVSQNPDPISFGVAIADQSETRDL